MGSTVDTIYPETRTRSRRRALRQRTLDLCVVGALLLVVCLVSLPRLADYVSRTNEADARVALALLGQDCFPDGTSEPVWALADMAGWSPTLRHRLVDARPLEGAEGLLYHGYLFALRPTTDGQTWLIAWPRRGECTGAAVYAWAPGQGALVAAPATRRRWSGVGGAEGLLNPADWSRPAARR